MSRYVQAVQVGYGGTVRVHGRPLGAVADDAGGVFVLLETGDATLRAELFEVQTVPAGHMVPEGGEFAAVVRLASGAPLAVYAVPAC